MNHPSFSREYLVLDGTSTIFLCASQHFQDIVLSLPIYVAITDVVRREARYFWGGPENNVRQWKEDIDLQPLIDQNILTEVRLTQTEKETMTNLSGIGLHNGEAATAAVAIHRNWSIATDDHDALARIPLFFPNLPITTTSSIIQHWSIETKALDSDIRGVLRSMRLRGGLKLSPKDPLFTWLREYIE